MSVANVIKGVVYVGVAVGGAWWLGTRLTRSYERFKHDTQVATKRVEERINTLKTVSTRLKHELTEGELKTISEAEKALLKPFLPELELVLSQLDNAIAAVIGVQAEPEKDA